MEGSKHHQMSAKKNPARSDNPFHKTLHVFPGHITSLNFAGVVFRMINN